MVKLCGLAIPFHHEDQRICYDDYLNEALEGLVILNKIADSSDLVDRWLNFFDRLRPEHKQS